MIDEAFNREILKRLTSGKSLKELNLADYDGRVDLRGLTLQEKQVIVRGARWNNLDFSGGTLGCLRMFAGQINDCRFDNCRMSGTRVWSTSFVNCSFEGAHLSGAMLGGVDEGKYNTFSKVDFTRADLSKTIYKAASFKQCIFKYAELVSVDFQSSSFTDCSFEGELRDVLFYRQGFNGGLFPPNKMSNVDFSRAKLHYVGFRGLVLDQVKLPRDDEHVIIDDFSVTLDKLVSLLDEEEDSKSAERLIGFLNIGKQWIPPQAPRIVNLRDLEETAGQAAVDLLRKVIHKLTS
jgi:uncharacterized protein YjbI with pentapeptide repeats